jgi:Ca2+-binding EF-hand superfamily protein
LGVIFAILDTDSNKKIDFTEFKKKIRSLHMRMEDDEIASIFRSMDANNDGNIAYNELVEMFSAINTAQIIRKMQKTILQSQVEPEFYFNRDCREDPTK